MRCILLLIILFGILYHDLVAQTSDELATAYYINSQKPVTAEVNAPLPHFYIAQGAYRIKNDYAVKDGVQLIWKGFNGYWENLYYRYSSFANAGLVLFWTLLATLYVFWLTISLRYYKSLTYRFFRDYYEHVRTPLNRLLLALLFAVLYAVGGWLIAACFAVGLMKKKEIVTTILLTVFSTMLFVMVTVFPQFFAYVKQPDLLKQLKIYDTFQLDSATQNELIRLKDGNPDMPLSKLLLAKYYKNNALGNNQSNNALALDYYRQASEGDLAVSLIHNNSGNIYFLNNDLEKARFEYEQALSVNPGNIYALYNLAYWHLIHRDDEKFSEYFGQAQKFAVEKNIILPEAKTDSVMLLDNELEREEVWRYFIQSMFLQKQSDTVFNTNLILIITLLPFFLLLIGLILPKFSHDFHSYTFCVSCDAPILPTSARAKYRKKILCPDCGSILTEKTHMTDVHKKRRMIGLFSMTKACVLNVIVPGSGWVYSGATLWGGAVTILSVLIVIVNYGSVFMFFPLAIDDMIFRLLWPLYPLLQLVTITVTIVSGLYSIRYKHVLI